jgi:2-oxoglutarate ferredoxin oxidoreductase subunit delta
MPVHPKIDEKYCKGCNICVAICPVRVYSEGETASSRGYIVPRLGDPEKCVDSERGPAEKKKCELCIYVCPDQAITWGYD